MEEVRYTKLSLAINNDDTLFIYDDKILVFELENQSDYEIVDSSIIEDWDKPYDALIITERYEEHV